MKILIQPETEKDFLAIPDGTEIHFYDGVIGILDTCKKCGTKLISIYDKNDITNIDELDFEDDRGDGSFCFYEYKNIDGNK